MRNLISGVGMTHLSKVMTPEIFSRYGGVLAKPTQGNHPNRAVELGSFWAADNNCFVKYDATAILRMLERYHGIPNCLFVNAPDVVCNHRATLFMFWFWQPIIKAYGFPVAFTLQNGVSLDAVPWHDCDAVFIGGDTPFKYSDLVARIVARAKQLHKHVHMGRVNSISRITYARSIGVDSFDGTGYCKWYRHIKTHLPYHSSEVFQLPLLEVG